MQKQAGKKLLSLLLALILVLGLVPMTAFAEENAEGAAPEAVETVQEDSVKHLTGYRHIDRPGRNNSPDNRKAASGAKQDTTLPSSYNSNALGLVTSVKNQEYGDCWTHAAMACVETYMIKYGIPVAVNGTVGAAATTSLNLSENAHAYFTYSKPYDKMGLLANDNTVLTIPTNSQLAAAGIPSQYYDYYRGPYQKGGNGWLSMYSLMRWVGPGNEATSAIAYNRNLSPTSTFDSKYAYDYDAAHVVNVIEVQNTDRDDVKRMIMQYGAGDFSYHATDYEELYFNSSTGAYYYPQSVTYNSTYGYYQYDDYANHAVTVVGWDDNYAISNFNSQNRPSSPGAWIIKNSWDTSYGDGGYIYISYEDTASLYETTFFYGVEAFDETDNIYQYDGTVNFSSYQTPDNGSSIATVYVANGREDLKAVALATESENIGYTLKIYTGVSNTDPTSGTLAATKTGTLQFCGYQRIELDSPVALETGDRFAVVFTLTCSDDIYLPVDEVGTIKTEDPLDGVNGWGLTWTHAQHANSSYQKTASGSWQNKSSSYNFRMKAYTDDVQEDPVPVTMVYHVCGGTAPAAATGTAGVTTVTLPTLTTAPTGWTFSGWAVASVAETTTKPTMYAGGASFRLTASVTDLYAVYEKTEQGEGGSSELTKATSISVGDTVVLVCESDTKELGGFNTSDTKYGIGTAYSGTPAGLVPLTVVAGSESGTFAFKTSDNKYVAWPGSGNSLSANSSIDAYASWSASFDSNGNVTLINGSDSVRQLFWNHNSPRFATYTNNNKTYGDSTYPYIQLYRNGPGMVTTYNSNPIVCDHTGYGTTTTTTDPTCTAVGYTIVSCANCGTEISRTEIPALGHLASSTYSSDETNHFHLCERCGLSVGDEEAHNFSDWTVTTPATEGAEGEQEHTCSVCGYVGTEAIPALGYNYTVTFRVPSVVPSIAPMTTNSVTNPTITLPVAQDFTSGGVNYTFVGWVFENVNNVTPEPVGVLKTVYTPIIDITMIALYSYTVGGEEAYELVEADQTDWSGDYLIAYDDDTFADGREGGKYGMGAQGVAVNPGTALSGKKVSAEWGDLYNVTLQAITGGYVMKTKDGLYNYQTNNSNGLASTENLTTASQYPLSVTFNSSSDIEIANAAGAVFHYNTQGYFRFYNNATQQPVYLYKRGGGTKYYTTVVQADAPVVAYINLVLTGEIRANAYVTIPDSLIESGIYYSLNGGTRTKLTLADKTEMGYLFSASMPAKEMYTPIIVSFTDESNNPITIYKNHMALTDGTFDFYIHDYSDIILGAPEGTYSTKLVDLCKAMSDYGYFAQIVKNYNVTAGSIAPTQYFSEDGVTYDAITVDSLNAYEYTKDALEGSTITAKSASLEMLSDMSLRVCFKVPAFVSAEDDAKYVASVMKGSSPYTTFTSRRVVNNETPTTTFEVIITGVLPSEFSTGFMVTLEDGEGSSATVGNFSVYSYIRLVLSQTGISEDVQNMVKSIYIFGEKAKAFFN